MKEGLILAGLLLFMAFADMLHADLKQIAIAIEARSGETGTGSTEGKSAGPQDIAKGGAA